MKHAEIKQKYYCNRHYQSVRKYRHPFGKRRESTSKFTVIGDILTVTTKSGEVFLADSEDVELLSKYSWCKSKKGYAVANIKGKVTKMHRFIMGVSNPEVIVDHKNRDRHDNRKSNLRICTTTENARNRSVSKHCSSGFIGIRITEYGKYNVKITFSGKEIHIGNYDTLEEAIRARKIAEGKYHGEFGSNNEI